MGKKEKIPVTNKYRDSYKIENNAKYEKNQAKGTKAKAEAKARLRPAQQVCVERLADFGTFLKA
jgi:hypothetical protein